ncbi:unnamed protein product [Parascedosporium putredinis]|uniref:Uncharacterized protein n=1 Tax=Parascedosporium putredinis TaxID=1442378 RepID=A0A9P1MEF1_9PEZI|nr:unnamed protein product [Parascedosporium putredinis]CAI8001398.1 unnamed protein product [Parascedosporium putredinis]
MQTTRHKPPRHPPADDGTASEDKWFIFAIGPNQQGLMNVHFHRSWTGIKAFELLIDTGVEGAHHEGLRSADSGPSKGPRITYIWWESHPDYCLEHSDEAANKEIARRACQWVLGVTLPLEHGVNRNPRKRAWESL